MALITSEFYAIALLYHQMAVITSNCAPSQAESTESEVLVDTAAASDAVVTSADPTTGTGEHLIYDVDVEPGPMKWVLQHELGQPIMEAMLDLDNVELRQTPHSTFFSMDTILFARHNNIQVAAWEPLVENWRAHAMFKTDESATILFK